MCLTDCPIAFGHFLWCPEIASQGNKIISILIMVKNGKIDFFSTNLGSVLRLENS